MHFKKILVGLLAATTLFGLVGCGAKETGVPSPSGVEIVDETEDTTEEAAPEEPELTVEELEAMIHEEYEKDSPDKDKILSLLTEASDKGSAYATYSLCYEYNSGKRLEKDDAKASEYYNLLKTLSDTDDAEALYLYGLCNMYGTGTDVDVQVALEYLEKGANAGNIDCYASLGNLYTGKYEGIERDEAKMFESYKTYCESATEDIDYSYYNGLGNCYLNGTGIEKDVDKAIEWYEKASDAGNLSTSSLLGDLYFDGYIDGNPDYEKALFYLERIINSDEDISHFTQYNIYCHAGISAGQCGDWVKAREYLNKSIELGEPSADDAQSCLDIMDENGR